MSEVKKLTKFDEVDMTGAQKYIKNVTVGALIGGKAGTVKTLEGIEKFGHDDIIMVGVKGETYPCSRETFEKSYIHVHDQVDVDQFRDTMEAKLTDESLSVMEELGLSKKDIHPVLKIIPVSAIQLKEAIMLQTDWGVQEGKAGDFLMFYGQKEVDGKMEFDRAVCARDEKTGLPLGYIKAEDMIIEEVEDIEDDIEDEEEDEPVIDM